MNINLKISRRNLVRIISFLIALVLILTGFVILNIREKNDTIKKLEYQYLNDLQNLSTHLNNIDTSLTKVMYSGTIESMSEISSKLWRESGLAKDCLSSLPVSSLNLSNTYKFISQLGEYSLALSKKSNENKLISNEDYNNLLKLRQYATNLLNEVLSLQDAINTGSIKTRDISKTIKNTNYNQEDPTITGGFTEFEEGFSDYPTLIYDGPFSDHILEKESEVVKQYKEISKEEALSKASQILKTDAKNIDKVYDEKGKIPAYCFYNDNTTIAISKNGGYLIYLLDNENSSSKNLSNDECIKKAVEFLNLCGYNNLKETYYEINKNIMTINFASFENNIIYYTDLIKVSVNMENGDIVSCDARGYLNNHKTRNNLEFSLSAEQAQKSVSSLLNIENINKVLIPTNITNEVPCYEFKCKTPKGEDLLVYINANTGQEEQILLLYIDENGTLTI